MFDRRELLSRFPEGTRRGFIPLGYLFVAASFHLLLSFLTLSPSMTPLKRADDDAVVVERWNEQDQKRIARTSRALDQATDEDIKARFGGEFKNRVKKETRARATGRFRQGDQTERDAVPSDEPGEIAMRDLMPFGQQNSVLPDEVEEGAETLLNTDRVSYASFFNRIGDEVYGPWVRLLEEAAVLLGGQLTANVYVTKIEVEIDDGGNVVSVRTVKSSGIPEVDQASKKAFWEAEPFPNPPPHIRETGRYTFGWTFYWDYRSSSYRIVPWRI